MSLLEVKNIDVHYGDFLALQNISLNVVPTEPENPRS